MKHKFQFSFTIITTCETQEDESGYNVKVGRTETAHGGDEFPKNEKGELDMNAIPVELLVGSAAARKVEQLVEDFLNSKAVKESIDHECDLAKLVFDAYNKKNAKEAKTEGGDK